MVKEWKVTSNTPFFCFHFPFYSPNLYNKEGVGKIALLANFLDLSGMNDLSMTHDDSRDLV